MVSANNSTGFKGKNWKLHLGVVLIGLFLDQITKITAVKAYSLPSGEINYHKITQVIGEWLQFRLVYNEGAAFGLQPQNLIPGIHPTLFFGVVSFLALIGLLLFYKSLELNDKSSQLGIAFITSGAFGNLADRLRIHKVVDFIDVGVPGFDLRWPTFNIADSCVCVGVGIILLWPVLMKKKGNTPPSTAGTENS